MARKLDEIAGAQFDGVMSPPRPDLKTLGSLRYWAITSFGVDSDVERGVEEAAALGAEALTVQLGDFDSSLQDMVKLANRICEAATRAALPTAIEVHRDTFTDTPERTSELQRAFSLATGEYLEICWDFSHIAVVRHLRPPFSSLLDPKEDILRSSQFHLRPFNGHHCQIPASDGLGGRAPEYCDWLEWARDLFELIRNSRASSIRIAPELGNAAPAYGLACFPDVWEDTKQVLRDLKNLELR